MPGKLVAILLALLGLGLSGRAIAGDRPARPVLQPTPLPQLRATPSRTLDRARAPASHTAALIAALGQPSQRPRTLLVPMLKRSAIGVVIVRRF